jgi:hypothetical protein
MKKEELYEIIEGIDEKYINEAEIVQLKRRRPAWMKWTAVAACLCLIVIGAIQFSVNRNDNTNVQQWSQSISAKDYFKNSHKANSQNVGSSASLVMPPYAVAVSINDKRSVLENAGVLPIMPSHLDHGFEVDYNGDGSLYKVTFLWMRRGEHGLDEYSDLQLIASPKELHEVNDVIVFSVDEDGNTLPEVVTVTERDGILIYARGKENEEKIIAWQTKYGWYQIVGSWNDSYEDMVELLDWFWEHPLSLSDFENIEEGKIVYSNRIDYPDAFCDQIPDFTALGYISEIETVNVGLCDGNLVPVWFEGIYTRGTVRISWTISIGADANAWKACLGRPNEITEEKLNDALSQSQSVNVFFDSPCMATLKIENGTSSDAWEIIQALQK